MVELTSDADRVLTLSDFAGAAQPGTRITTAMRWDQMKEFGRLAGKVVPVAGTFRLDEIAEAARLSRSRHPGGKLLVLP